MARQSTTFMVPFRKAALSGLPASRMRNSTVKYEMQMASTSASLGLSTGSPLMSLICIQGKVLKHIPQVEINTKLQWMIDISV